MLRKGSCVHEAHLNVLPTQRGAMFSAPTHCPPWQCKNHLGALLYLAKAWFSPAQVSGRCWNQDGNEVCGSEVVHPEAGRHWEEVGQPPANLVVGVEARRWCKEKAASACVEVEWGVCFGWEAWVVWMKLQGKGGTERGGLEETVNMLQLCFVSWQNTRWDQLHTGRVGMM